MVDITTPNLPGANELFNTIARKVESIDTSALENMASDASGVISQLKTDLTDLKAKTGAVLPELPTTVPTNLQSELTALTGLSLGSSQYTDKLSSITSKFGSSLTASGYNLDTIVSDASTTITNQTSAIAAGTSSVSISSALSAKVPNFELSPGATEAVEKAKASLLATAPALKELAHSFSESVTQDDTKGVYGDKVARDTQATNLQTITNNLKTFGEAFAKKADALNEEIKRRNAEQREENTVYTIGV
tara:strand:- start:1414 stop:2160 length:747 start_codon:yes stop_codon:yes gene_type:complete